MLYFECQEFSNSSQVQIDVMEHSQIMFSYQGKKNVIYVLLCYVLITFSVVRKNCQQNIYGCVLKRRDVTFVYGIHSSHISHVLFYSIKRPNDFITSYQNLNSAQRVSNPPCVFYLKKRATGLIKSQQIKTLDQRERERINLCNSKQTS